MSDKLPPQVLVLESDEFARNSLCNAIERYWFSVLRAPNAETAMRLLSVNKPHVIVLGANITDSSILEAGIQIREKPTYNDMPYVLALLEGESQDGYKSLDNGMIEFITKPYNASSVMTMIKALLRRSKPIFKDKIIRYKDISMDLATYKVARGAKNIHLGPTEFKILQLLVQSPKVIFARQQVIDYVWGVDMNIEHRTVDVHVNRIRSLIRKHKDELPFIKTVRTSGYCLNLPGEVD
jgi:two-component system, OmpR family, phosphate regulon response regulator PhoB